MLKQLKQLAMLGHITDLDYHFAAYIAGKNQPASAELLLACALLSQQTGQGHVCIELKRFAEQPLFGTEKNPEIKTLYAPRRADWRKAIQGCRQVSGPGNQAMMILDGADRLYLAKYWQFEDRLAQRLLSWADHWVEVDEARLKEGLQRLFPSQLDEPDWQQLAAATALLKPFAVISGGPGTGKTTTVAKLLALLVDQGGATPPRIALAAPTGKAAARLSESIKEKKQHLACSEQVKGLLPDEAVTLHRLLGVRPGRVDPRHHRDNPLHLDVLVVDEASMIDLPLMGRLVDALPERARLILLGDKDQLASVEAGSVLANICDAGLHDGYSPELTDRLQTLTGAALTPASRIRSPLIDAIALLRKSYRFDAASGIGALARAINEGNAEFALNCFDDMLYGDVSWRTISAASLSPSLRQQVAPRYQDYFRCADPLSALVQFNHFRVLCALRQGPFGVGELNREIERGLIQRGVVPPEQRWYKGRPIMITRNDYSTQLFNGDMGIIWPDPENDRRLRAFFVMPDGRVRKILPGRLPEHETVYAMTVHKSQGSEFDQVLLVLPDEPSPVLTRELVYTGITRGKQQVELWGREDVFRQAVATKMARDSGLQAML